MNVLKKPKNTQQEVNSLVNHIQHMMLHEKMGG